MARKKTSENQASKKQKTTSGATGVQKRTELRTGPPSRGKRKQLSRNTPSEDSQTPEPEDPPPKTPTFRQPRSSRTTTDNNEESDEESDQVSDEEESDKENTKYMRQLPRDDRYQAMGKAFTLKHWPWSSPNWWVDGDECAEYDSKYGLYARNTFTWYMETVLIERSEWITSSFRSSVSITFCI